MVQVLHLMSTCADFQAMRTAEQIRRDTGPDVTVTTATVGRGGTYRSAAYAAAALRFGGGGTLLDVVHAWDTPSVLGAAGGPTPVVFSPSTPTPATLSWLRAAIVYRNGTVIATSNAMRRSLVRGRIPGARCDVIRPPLNPAHIPELPDERLRRELGFGPEDKVILAPGESVRCSGHRIAIHAASILHVLDPRFHILVWGRGAEALSEQRLAEKLGQPRLVVSAEHVLRRRVQFEDLAGVADLAMVTPPDACELLPIAVCMAARLPIVAAPSPAVTGLLINGQTALVTDRMTPRLLAQRTMELDQDPNLARRIGRQAGEESLRRFNPRLSSASYLALYSRLAGITPAALRPFHA